MNGPFRSSDTDQPVGAWVLHRRPYRESSALVELFTEGYGRVGAVARGAGKRGWRGLLEPFTPLLVQWSGRHELHTLRHAEPAGRPVGLRGAALACGFYLSELTLALTRREDPHPGTWQAYGQGLAELAEAVRDAPLRRFELALLEEAGYGLQLEQDVHGASVRADTWYRYDVESGPAPFAGDHGTGAASPVVRGACLLALADRDTLGETEAREARILVRRILHHHLGGRVLRSRELFRAMQGENPDARESTRTEE